MVTKSVVIVFLDGVGLGDADIEANPFMHVEMESTRSLLGVSRLTREAMGTVTDRATLLGLDPLLGVPGLPQSATGQTTILTGQNAPALLGEHYGPYPNQRLRDLLTTGSIFKIVAEAGYPVAYANAYPDRFLDRLQRGKGRLSANTFAAHASGLKLRNREDLEQGRAISALLSNDLWPESNVKLPTLTAHQAGRQLVSIANEYSLTFFEFWYSDLLGHKMDREGSIKILRALDDFFAGILEAINLEHTLLLVVSDHGNFENWTTKKHTETPAITILAGQNINRFIPGLQSLADLKQVILPYIFGKPQA